MQILLSRTQAGQGRTVKQEQDETLLLYLLSWLYCLNTHPYLGRGGENTEISYIHKDETVCNHLQTNPRASVHLLSKLVLYSEAFITLLCQKGDTACSEKENFI